MLKDIGLAEIITVAVILLILFGGNKLPELGRGLGEGVRELKKSLRKDEPKPKAKSR